MNVSSPRPVEITDLQSRLLEVITFLDPLLPLVNCHMVEYITDNLWETVIPSNIRDEVNCNDDCRPNTNDLIIKMYQSDQCEPSLNKHVTAHTAPCSRTRPRPSLQAYHIAYFPNLFHFVTAARNSSLVSLPDITSSWLELQEKFILESSETLPSLHVDQFMTFKKAHEVEMMTTVVALVANVCKASHIVDIGSGKGYLSSMLALHHGLNVLGIDSSHNNSHGAATRTKKLLRVWESISKKGKRSVCSIPSVIQNPLQEASLLQNTRELVPNSVTNTNDSSPYVSEGHMGSTKKTPRKCSYKQATVFVTPSIDVQSLVENYFPDSGKSQHLALVGLHTCGDLASTAFRIFASNQHIKGLCIVGCCYHLLSEKFVFNEETLPEPVDDGFPMSDFLKSRQFVLGRNARMLAAQSLERILDSSRDNNQSLDSLFYRALLQVLLKEKLGQDYLQGQVGRLAAKCSNFSDYVHKALNKLGLSVEVTEAEIEALYTKHIAYRAHLEAFFMFRLILAPVVECIILLDRLLFLFEQGVSEAHLVPMFDPLVSPRCYGIVALQKQH